MIEVPAVAAGATVTTKEAGITFSSLENLCF